MEIARRYHAHKNYSNYAAAVFRSFGRTAGNYFVIVYELVIDLLCRFAA